jgi:hypothetical protein
MVSSGESARAHVLQTHACCSTQTLRASRLPAQDAGKPREIAGRRATRPRDEVRKNYRPSRNRHCLADTVLMRVIGFAVGSCGHSRSCAARCRLQAGQVRIDFLLGNPQSDIGKPSMRSVRSYATS